MDWDWDMNLDITAILSNDIINERMEEEHAKAEADKEFEIWHQEYIKSTKKLYIRAEKWEKIEEAKRDFEIEEFAETKVKAEEKVRTNKKANNVKRTRENPLVRGANWKEHERNKYFLEKKQKENRKRYKLCRFVEKQQNLI